jgi:hypothetical protein
MILRTVLSKSTSLVTQQVLNSSKVFWNRASPDDCSFDALIVLNEPCIDRLAHVKVDTQTDGYDGGEEDQEPHH